MRLAKGKKVTMNLKGRALALATAILTPAAAFAAQDAAPAATTAAPAVAKAAPAAAAAAPAAPAFQYAPAQAGIGVPDGRMGVQDQVTQLGQRAADFHNHELIWMCFIISAFVLVLMAVTMWKFRRRPGREPSKTSHHTLLEVIWTAIPVFILIAIAIPSINLIRAQYSPPKADLTIKVTGNQWFWTYSYPDNGDFEIISNLLKEKGDVKPGERFRTDADGPPLLAVDERIVIPAGKVVKFLVTSNDVIHSFAVPAFWTKIDANPGRINETWVKVDRPGVYFGQCSELCGARHGYMPISVEVVTPERFAEWVASKGGTMPGAAKPSTADAVNAGTAVPADAANENAAAPADAANENAAAPAPTENQAATAQN
jgi:cytochrome c oxidase subunit 2